jgi:hypothetical protein
MSSHPLARIARNPGRHMTSALASSVPQARPLTRLRAEGDGESCSCTGTAIGYTLLGAVLGVGGMWFVSDAKKASIKAGAKARAASAADRAAARLRR